MGRDRWSEPAAELDQRLALDLLDQVAHQLVEQRDVIVGVGIGAGQEQIRHLLQNREALGPRSLRQRRLQFSE